MINKTARPETKTLAAGLKPNIRALDNNKTRTVVQDLFADGAGTAAKSVLDFKPVLDFMAAVAGHSPYLSGLIARAPQDALALFSREPEAALQDILAQARRDCAATQSEPEVMEILRRMKRRAHLLIALADTGGAWDVVQVTRAITEMADCAVSTALAFLLKQAAAQGKLKLADPGDPEKNSGVVILALGKHGARELNYSSDVDLVIFYDPQSASLAPSLAPAFVESAGPARLFVNITRSLVKLLQERTGDGYVARVDLRLRPDPGSTAAAISLPAAFHYYETLGQNWERAAFIKARPVAGDLEIGARFIAGIAPFIWRRYFDYAAIADIHAMKRQIHAVRGHSQIAVAGHDIKLGRGGIREIEFFVQTQQLVFGGRRPQLRGARTLDMLVELNRDGWVSKEAVRELTASYKFLRMIEHRLQMINDEQTQRLPSEAAELERFARFCGYATVVKFSNALLKYLSAVERHYARLFEHATGLDSSTGSLVFTGAADDPATIETLLTLGFAHPSRTIETIRGWHFGRRPAVQSARAREVLTELIPALIESFSGSGDPDAALLAFDNALTRMPAAIELFSILKSNKTMRDLFADILGGAPRLAGVIARRPHVLDAAMDPALWDIGRAQGVGERVERLLERFQAKWHPVRIKKTRQNKNLEHFHVSTNREDALGANPGMEELLDTIRDLYQEESFLIGVRLLSASITARAAGHAYSGLAGEIVRACLATVLRNFKIDHGAIAGGRCAIFGLGKLGSREMTASSDLDLVILYDYDDDHADSTGRAPLHAARYYARVAQRLISALTVSTRRGSLYEVDMRLRPSGNQGPVATRFASFRAYQLNDAETWEHMALTRARFIAGDKSLGDEVTAVVSGIVSRPRDEQILAQDIAAMRKLIAREKGEDKPWDLKLAAGGVIDLEFIMQFLILRDAKNACQLLALLFDAPEDIFRKAAATRYLSVSQADALAAAYAAFTSIMQLMRLTSAGEFDPGNAASGVLRRIALAMNAPDFRHVSAELDAHRKEVRAIFSKLIG